MPEIERTILDLTSLLLLPLPLQLRQPRRVLGLRAGGGVGGLAANASTLAEEKRKACEARSLIERHGRGRATWGWWIVEQWKAYVTLTP